ncbi:MAG: hypothetical protein Q8K37_01670 [Alphaproteobacteria bacterium]|nr:hypothetical protein [Alphaproteobacteria bacterium]
MKIEQTQTNNTKKNYIFYKLYNSYHTNIIISQLEYWFSKMGDKFYKFIEPSSNQRSYREGDSWTEELCVSRKTFTRAFDKIGTRHKSKTSFKESKDKFQGKLYASYYDRQTKQTVFLKNTEIVTSKFNWSEKSLKTEKLKQHTKPLIISDKVKKPIKAQSKNIHETLNTHIQNDIKINAESNSKETSFKIKTASNTNESAIFFKNNIPFYNGQNDRSGYIYKYIYITKTTSTKQTSNLNQNKNIELADKNELVKEIKNIWIEKIGDEEKTSQISSEEILKAFIKIFNGSIENWKEYCIKISSSNFLMGRIKNTFKIWISWALKKETYDRINAGDLGVLKTEPIKVDFETNKVLNSILLNHSEKNIQDAFIEISKRIESYRFNSWFKGTTLQAIEGKTAFLKVKDRLSSDYIRRNFSSELSFCFNKFNPEIKNIEIFS